MQRPSLEAEISAAMALAARLGLGAFAPEVLKLARHTTLRLSPLPIVARIRSGDTDVALDAMRREVLVATHLASCGAPAVRPAAVSDAGPHVEQGCAISLWEFVDGRTVQTDAEMRLAAAALKRVHAALEKVTAELPPFTRAIDSCETILADPAAAIRLHPADRQFLEGRFRVLREALRRRAPGCRPLHGDTHPGNVLMTASGAVWMDLEAVCRGPIEWDVVSLPPRARREFHNVDPELMALLADLRSVCVATWCWADFDRSAEVAEAAVHHLARLKARFG